MEFSEEAVAMIAKAVVDAYRRGRQDELKANADFVENFPQTNVTTRRHQHMLAVQLRRMALTNE